MPEENEESVRSDDAVTRLRLPKEAILANGVITNAGSSKPLVVRNQLLATSFSCFNFVSIWQVFINKKSGGKQGEGLLRTFRALLSQKQARY